MYTGTLIEDLIAAVERAEQHARTGREEAEPERWYAGAQYEAVKVEQTLLGVA
jgi:hypothetical protein